MPSWSPDVELSEERVLLLLARHFPELNVDSLRLYGAGWDNHAYLVNDSLVFRIPHRKMGGELMELENALLPWLAQKDLPLQIPNPIYRAAADNDYPYPIGGYSLVQGQTADSIVWTNEERGSNACTLGSFLKTLHAVEANVPWAVGDKIRRADLSYRFPIVVERLSSPPLGFLEMLEELATTPAWDRPTVWVHGDLYSRHLVANENHELVGVIDWGDAHVGDPALDLAIVWMFLPPESWPEFFEAYGEVDPATWRRARFRAMTHWAYLRDYAADQDDSNLTRELDLVLRNVMRKDKSPLKN